jgi:hypothetical protein
MATRSDHGAVIGTGITTGALVHMESPGSVAFSSLSWRSGFT